jgi:hypothetical protein
MSGLLSGAEMSCHYMRKAEDAHGGLPRYYLAASQVSTADFVLGISAGITTACYHLRKFNKRSVLFCSHRQSGEIRPSRSMLPFSPIVSLPYSNRSHATMNT